MLFFWKSMEVLLKKEPCKAVLETRMKKDLKMMYYMGPLRPLRKINFVIWVEHGTS